MNHQPGYHHTTMSKFFDSGIVQPVKMVLTNLHSGLTQEVTYYFEDGTHFYCRNESGINLYHKSGWKRDLSHAERSLLEK